ncbi:hypothetical protein [Lactiplantibacillus plantarum]|uniref:hypothetical protein n=1 Tax=Lactiplantibacillus plantarum TaxID=1590 RepID=UPI0018AD591B|nr:hypothetical protein [Lactiplantibacillus plantarum]WGF83436.1 hypothetical protein QB909_09055 [Lactiplantibacillus plantarum]WGG40761.1 hypothetical protein QCL57_09055 [Lactiplantibacillus plantarum]
MKYFNESLNFNVWSTSKDYYGLSYDSFRKLLDSIILLIHSKAIENNLTVGQMKIRSPFHCVTAENQDSVVIGISNENALRLGTIYSMCGEKMVDLNEQELEKKVESMTANEIGYAHNTFTSVDKTVFENSDVQKALNDPGSFMSNFIGKMKELTEYLKKSESSEKLNRLNRMITCWNMLNMASMTFVNNLKKEANIMNINPIFKAKNLAINEKQIFYVLEFNSKRQEIFKVVKQALESTFDLSVIKSGSIFTPNQQDIMENIWISICTAKFVVVDISDRNPNVFYELGICHTLGKPTMMICDKESFKNDYDGKLPFDINTIGTVFYDNTMAGGDSLKQEVIARADGFINNKPVILN